VLPLTHRERTDTEQSFTVLRLPWIRGLPIVEPVGRCHPKGSTTLTAVAFAWTNFAFFCPSFKGDGRAMQGDGGSKLLLVSFGFSPSWLADSPVLPRGRAEESRTGIRWVKQWIAQQQDTRAARGIPTVSCNPTDGFHLLPDLRTAPVS